MTNTSDKRGRENQNRAVYDIMWKIIAEPDGNKAYAFCMPAT
jgi:hypothetical protein